MEKLNHANNLFLEKKFQNAVKKYEEVLEKDPRNLTALNNLGYTLSKLKI